MKCFICLKKILPNNKIVYFLKSKAHEDCKDFIENGFNPLVKSINLMEKRYREIGLL